MVFKNLVGIPTRNVMRQPPFITRTCWRAKHLLHQTRNEHLEATSHDNNLLRSMYLKEPYIIPLLLAESLFNDPRPPTPNSHQTGQPTRPASKYSTCRYGVAPNSTITYASVKLRNSRIAYPNDGRNTSCKIPRGSTAFRFILG